MSRYSTDDPYSDAATGVLNNRFGIKDRLVLEQLEAKVAAARSYELATRPLKGNFDLAHLRAIHRHLFGDIYEWAGELRQIDIRKGESPFAHHAYIENAAAEVFRRLAREKHLAGLSVDNFSQRAGYYLSEINALHPFREGNGRAQREFISQLACANGYYIAWEGMEQTVLLSAMIEAFGGKLTGLTALIRANLREMRP